MSSPAAGTAGPFITGIGLATPLGIGADPTFAAILAGESIGDHFAAPADPACRRSKVAHLALTAATEALAQASWPADARCQPRTALVLGTSKGPVETWITPLSQHMHNPPYVIGGSDGSFGLATLVDELATDLGLTRAPRWTLSAACASSLQALIHAALLIRHGRADRALVVGAEASVHPLFLGSFRRLGVLPPAGHPCRPFDRNRAGFLMSDAAAAVCLDRTGGNVAIDAFGWGADPTHLTGLDPDGKSLRYVITQALAGQSVDLAHAHGTGTPTNDPVELAAIEASLAADAAAAPVLWSHKAALGHTLGAAGLVGVVLSCLIHRQGVVPANVHTPSPLPTTRVRLEAHAMQVPVRRSVVVAAGFGGALAAVTLRSAT